MPLSGLALGRIVMFSPNLSRHTQLRRRPVALSSNALVDIQSRGIARLRGLQGRISRESRLFLAISLVHFPLGVVLYNAGPLALLHPIAVVLLGMLWAFQRHVTLDRVALVVAYLIGSEVLWRMAKIPVPWEFGKYSSVAIMFVALMSRKPFKVPLLSSVYFLVLLPACIFPLAELDVSNARAQISSTLSGPLLLAMSCWFFSNIKLTPLRLRRLVLGIVIPLLSVASTTLFYTVTADDLNFTTESNFATSGGFGPNQVSAMLGLGVFLSVCCLVLFKIDKKLKVLLGFAAIFFAAQSALTFSRSGIYSAIGASLAVLLLQFRNLGQGVKRLVPILALSGVFFLFVFPALNDFTDGKLHERFEDTGTSNRVEIAQTDFEIFFEHPILGVGVGMSNEYRRRVYGYGAGSHTEFSRLISEHGIFGVAALLSLSAMAIINFKRQKSTIGRALVAGVSVWCVLFMINAGTRLGAPSYLWGLMFTAFVRPRSWSPLQRLK